MHGNRWEPYNMMRRLALTCGAALCNSLGETTVSVVSVLSVLSVLRVLRVYV